METDKMYLMLDMSCSICCNLNILVDYSINNKSLLRFLVLYLSTDVRFHGHYHLFKAMKLFSKCTDFTFMPLL